MALRILVVDDDAVDREAIRRALRRPALSVEVAQASDATEALALLAAGPFDLVLCDYRLPGRDGLELLRLIRARPDAPPVIILTGSGDEELVVELMRAGAADYIPKAVLGPERLEGSIRQVLRLHQAEREAKRAARELDRYAAQLQGLATASVQISARLQPSEVLRTFAESAVTLFRARTAALSVAHPDWAGAALHLLAPTGQAVTSPLERLTEALAGLSAPLRLEGSALAGSGPHQALATAAGLPVPQRAWLGAPLLDADGRPVGALHLYEPESGTFSASDQDIAAQLARMAGVALDNAYLFRRAQEATRLRDEVMGVVSHDLRNPLQVISVAASLLAATDRDERRLAQIGKIHRSVDHAHRLIRDLLDVTRMDSGRLHVQREPMPLRELLEEAVEQVRPLAQEQGLQLALKAGPLPSVALDRTRIGQVLSNLLGNALKFTPRGGQVTVRATSEPTGVVVSVADTGRGILPEHLPRVFERFFQADGDRRRGAGLGLAIVQGIIAAHEGRVWVESEPGKGATFSFWLPAAGAEGERRGGSEGEPRG